MKKQNNQQSISELIKAGSGIRTISFNHHSSDPYVMYHESAEELSDARLDALYGEWRSSHDEPEENEDFENFLDWLTEKNGFVYLPVAEAMKNFG